VGTMCNKTPKLFKFPTLERIDRHDTRVQRGEVGK